MFLALFLSNRWLNSVALCNNYTKKQVIMYNVHPIFRYYTNEFKVLCNLKQVLLRTPAYEATKRMYSLHVSSLCRSAHTRSSQKQMLYTTKRDKLSGNQAFSPVTVSSLSLVQLINM